MFRSVFLTSLIVSCSAFVPSQRAPISMAVLAEQQQVVNDLNLEEMFEVFDAAERKQEFSAVAGKSKRSFKDEIGAQAPLGFFDPLGLLRDADEAKFQRLRYVETKHGRIAMLAILGHIVTTKGDRLGGAIAPGVSFSSIKSGLAALDQIPQQEIWEIVAFIGLMEWGFSTVQQPLEEYFEEVMSAGQKWSADKIRWKKAIELNNGRAAQMGILGLMVHEKLNNDPYIINSLLGAPVPFNQ